MVNDPIGNDESPVSVAWYTAVPLEAPVVPVNFVNGVTWTLALP